MLFNKLSKKKSCWWLTIIVLKSMQSLNHATLKLVEKCVIFGIDGADFYLTRQLMDEGDLPNLKCISQNGSYNSLLSTIPPLTPQAWSSFACGVNPGKHLSLIHI